MSGYDEFFSGANEDTTVPFTPAFAEAEIHNHVDELPPTTNDDPAKNYGCGDAPHWDDGSQTQQPQDRPPIK